MDYWKDQEITGIWLQIPIQKSELIPKAVSFGFEFHHTEPNYLMMTQWLSPKKNMLPKYTTHFVGIGGFVMNDAGEVLLIKEYRSEYDMAFWKIPGGMVDPNESLQDAAMREIFEEAGV